MRVSVIVGRHLGFVTDACVAGARHIIHLAAGFAVGRLRPGDPVYGAVAVMVVVVPQAAS